MFKGVFSNLFKRDNSVGEVHELKPVTKTGLIAPPYRMPTEPPKSFADEAINRVLLHEGGYSDHPADKGGKTNYGITEAVARQNGYQGDMRDLSLDFAVHVYKRSYWNAVQADKFHNAVAFQLFDACVNHGKGNAIKILQRAVGIKADGVLGPVTFQAVNSISPSTACMFFLSERLRFYTEIKTWPSFGRGWTKRMAENLTYAGGDCD